MKRRITIDLTEEKLLAMDEARTALYLSRSKYILMLLDKDIGEKPSMVDAGEKPSMVDAGISTRELDHCDFAVGNKIYDTEIRKAVTIEGVRFGKATVNGVEHNKDYFFKDGRFLRIIN